MGIHKKIIGGEQYLPFALSKLRELAIEAGKRGGYATRIFIVDGGTRITLNVMRDEHFLVIEGGSLAMSMYRHGLIEPVMPPNNQRVLEIAAGTGADYTGGFDPQAGSTALTLLSPDGRYSTLLDTTAGTDAVFYKADPVGGSPIVLATVSYGGVSAVSAAEFLYRDNGASPFPTIGTIGNITPFVKREFHDAGEGDVAHDTTVCWVDPDEVLQTIAFNDTVTRTVVSGLPVEGAPPGTVGDTTVLNGSQFSIRSVVGTDFEVYVLLHELIVTETASTVQTHEMTFSTELTLRVYGPAGMSSHDVTATGPLTQTIFDGTTVVSSTGDVDYCFGGLMPSIKGGNVRMDILEARSPINASTASQIEGLYFQRQQEDGSYVPTTLATWSGATNTFSAGLGLTVKWFPSAGAIVKNWGYCLNGCGVHGLGPIDTIDDPQTYFFSRLRYPGSLSDPDIYAPMFGFRFSDLVIVGTDAEDGDVRTIRVNNAGPVAVYTQPTTFTTAPTTGAIVSKAFKIKTKEPT